MKYLIKMTPLEPYTFGGKKGLYYPGVVKEAESTYYVQSEEIPQQTTVFGALRYLVLSHTPFFHSDFNYTDEEREKIADAIGKSSFSFDSIEKQDFGSIKGISPLFLIHSEKNEEEEILVPTPAFLIKERDENGNETGAAHCMKIGQETIRTSSGNLCLPENGEYNCKEGYAGGFYGLKTHKIYENLIDSVVNTGIRKNGDEDAFFKMEEKILAKNYSFAVIAEADSLPERSIIYMGLRRSAFIMECIKDCKINLESEVKKAFADVKGIWFYALSDLYTVIPERFDTFCIVKEKYAKNLQTQYNSKKHRNEKLKRSEEQYALIGSGSCFYMKKPTLIQNKNGEDSSSVIGYNKLIEIGE